MSKRVDLKKPRTKPSLVRRIKPEIKKCGTLKQILAWTRKNTTLNTELQRHHSYNLYLTLLGFRPAFLTTIGFDVEKFARDFSVKFKRGPYFDIVGTNFSYVINPAEFSRLEPLFDELERTYVDDEKKMKRRYKRRVDIIGTILGFEGCLGDSPGPNTYAISFFVTPKNKLTEKSEVFSYLCGKKHIESSAVSALQLITNATPYFKSCKLVLGFEILYPYEP